MMSDVPFGVFLSGGVDSSANVALMSEQMSRPVETFTVGFTDAEYLNELEQARRIAKQFGTNHHEVIISEKEMHEFLPQMVFHQDEPIADPVCVPLYYVSKLARDSGTIVVQVGEGSDEIFSGYENYVRHLRIYENFWRHAETLPLSLRRAISNLSRPALEATGRKRAAIEFEQRQRAARFLAFPVQASGDHQVQHEVQIAVEVEHDAFSQSRETDDGFAVDIGKRGNRGAQQEGIEDTDRRQPLAAQQAFEAFDVDRDVGKLRHASMIRSACMSFYRIAPL
jgi:asparagine synthetase B (glutamine-hydrolysing)